MPWRLPDSFIDDTHTWNNHNDQVMFERAFETEPGEEQKMALSLLCANPGTSETFIRNTLQNPSMTDRTAPSFPPPTIEEVFARSQAPTGDNDMARQAGAH